MIKYMPVENEQKALTRWMTLRKGTKSGEGKGTRLVNLDAFVPHFTEAFAPQLEQHFWQVLGLDDNKQLPQVIKGLYAITDDFMDDVTYYRSFQEYGGQSQIRRCNGEHQERIANFVLSIEEQGYTYYGDEAAKPEWFQCRRSSDQISCYDPNTKKGCRLTCRLRLTSPQLASVAGLPQGYMEFSTGALSDDRNILNSFFYIQTHYVERYGVPLSNIPLMVYRMEDIVAGRKMQVIKLSVDSAQWDILHSRPVVVSAVTIEDGEKIGGTVEFDEKLVTASVVENDHLDEELRQLSNGKPAAPDLDHLDDWFDANEDGGYAPEDEAQENSLQTWAEWVGEYNLENSDNAFIWLLTWVRDHVPERDNYKDFAADFARWHSEQYASGLKLKTRKNEPDFTEQIMEYYANCMGLFLDIGRFCANEKVLLFAEELRCRPKGHGWRWYFNCHIFNPQVFSRQALADAGFGAGNKSYLDNLLPQKRADYVLPELFTAYDLAGAIFTIEAKDREVDNGTYFTVSGLRPITRGELGDNKELEF